MKESVGIVGVFQIVILFILLFTGIMCLTLNNTNAFAVKNELINTIVALDGNIYDANNSDKLNEDIVNVVTSASYRNTGRCDEGYTGYDKLGNETSHGNAAVCIKEVPVTDQLDKHINEAFSGKVGQDDFIKGKYFKVMVFYQLDLPVVNQVYNMKNVGETKIIYHGGI